MSKPKRSFRELRDDLAAQVESFRKWRESATDREEELLFESLAKFYPDLYEAADAGRRARGEPPIQDLEKIAKWRTHYEKAYYGKLRHSKKGREAVDFLRRLRMKCLFVAERVCGASDSEQGYERQLLEACEETFTLLGAAAQRAAVTRQSRPTRRGIPQGSRRGGGLSGTKVGIVQAG